jgi:hypothetical protein
LSWRAGFPEVVLQGGDIVMSAKLLLMKSDEMKV